MNHTRRPQLSASILLFFALLLSTSVANAEVRVLLLAYDDTTLLAEALRAHDSDLVITERTLDEVPVTEEIFARQDLAVVWTNHNLPSPEAGEDLGNLLADFVDDGGGVVEMVYGQYDDGEHLIAGQWRTGSYACVGPAEEYVSTDGSLGTFFNNEHPIARGVESFYTENGRTGSVDIRQGADIIATYRDGQTLVATRQTGDGRVAWLGFYPGNPSVLRGDWQTLLDNTILWSIDLLREEKGKIVRIDEGTTSTYLEAPELIEDIRSVHWDLNGDGGFDDAEGLSVEVNTAGLDGPDRIRTWALITGEDNSTRRVEVRVLVENLPPVVQSSPPLKAGPGDTISYTLDIVDPAGDKDRIRHTLIEAPEGASLSEDGTLTWAVEESHVAQSFAFHIEIRDDDKGVTPHQWTLEVTAGGADGDGIPNHQDNCPDIRNANQTDLDEDNLGDECDDDIDGDGLDNAEETSRNTNPRDADTDSDGLNDGDEIAAGTDPLDMDTDGDTLRDGEEAALRTDPLKKDTDSDGLDDAEEQALGSNPRVVDSDADGLDDAEEAERGTNPTAADSDNGGISDLEEIRRGTNPLDRSDDVVTSDSDGGCTQGSGSPSSPAAPLAFLGALGYWLSRQRRRTNQGA